MKKVRQINKGGQNSSWAKNKTEARPLGIEGIELREGNMETKKEIRRDTVERKRKKERIN